MSEIVEGAIGILICIVLFCSMLLWTYYDDKTRHEDFSRVCTDFGGVPSHAHCIKNNVLYDFVKLSNGSYTVVLE